MRQRRYLKFAVQTYHAVFLQLFQYLLAAACHIAHGICGIYVLYHQRIAVDLVECDGYLKQDLHSHLQGLARLGLEIGFQLKPCAAPDIGFGLGQEITAGSVLLHKFQIAVSLPRGADAAYLRLHPVGIGHLKLQSAPDAAVEFK